MQIVDIFIEGQKLELFTDENIEINSSVQNVKDVSKVFTDFSKSFTVPASKNNNKIFSHYYKSDITGGFDARTKKAAYITINNIRYKQGRVRLDKVNLSNKIAKSYTITFFGDVVKIKDLIGDDKLKDLDYLDGLDHDYTSSNVFTGFTDGLDLLPTYDQGVIYPLISPVRRFLYDSGTDTTDDDSNVNIAPVGTNGLSWRDLKPAIRLIHIIEAIEDKYDLTFTRDFFGRSEFYDLYMWLNKDQGLLQSVSSNSNSLIDWSTGDSTFINFTTDTLVESLVWAIPTGAGAPNVPFPEFLRYEVTITPDAGFENVEYSVLFENNGAQYLQQSGLSGVQEIDGVFPSPATPNDTVNLSVQFFVNSNESFNYTAEATITKTLWINQTSATCGTATNTIQGEVIITKQMPDLKTIEFFKGLLRQFNLVTVAQEDGSIYVNTLSDWYAAGRIFDITKYVDTKKIDVKREKLFQNFSFNYKEPKSLLAIQFEENFGIAYGDLEASLFDSQGEPLDGGSLQIKSPFENMVYERITDLDTNSLTTLQYGFYVNKELSPVVGAPLLFYKNELSISDNPIAFKDSSGSLTNITSNVILPNHAVNLLSNPDFTMNFGRELSTYNFNEMENGLYKVYWQDYITDIFSENRRIYDIEAVLPLSINSGLLLNDRLVISDRRYLINNIKSNLLNNKVQLELVNDIYSGLNSTDLLENLILSIYYKTVQKEANSFSITATGKGNISVSLVDVGFGVFCSLSTSLINETGNVIVNVNQNGSTERQMIIRFIGEVETVDFVLIQQSAGSITADNTIITADNTIITADNI